MVHGYTSELSLGVRKYWDFLPYNIYPFIGGGLSDIKAVRESSEFGPTISNSGSAFGYWVGGGVIWVLGNHFILGLDIRMSNANVVMGGISEKAGGEHSGVLLGFHY